MSLIDSLKNEIDSSTINQISEKTGLSTEQTNEVFSAGIPAVLAGLLKNSSSGSGFLGRVLSSFTGDKLTEAPNADVSHEGWLSKGKSAIDNIFGTDAPAVVNAIGNKVGLDPEKSSGLLAMIVPFITNGISKLITSNGWGLTDFFAKLWESKSEISSALPAELSSSLSLTSLDAPNINMPHVSATPIESAVVMPDNVTSVEESRVEAPKASQAAIIAEAKQSNAFLPWFIGIVIIGLALWFFLGKGCNTDKTAGKVDSLKNHADAALVLVKGKLNEAGDYIFDLGDTVSKKLPDGKEISVGSNSVENHLIMFIEDKNKPVDKTTWFTFDRLYFETGKSILKPESQNQLENIVVILNAFPAVKLKLGGYTDNTGDAAVNKTISNERANVALKALIALGIAANRLEAEGYGAEHPVASNETAEGRAQNRRIDVRVTNK